MLGHEIPANCRCTEKGWTVNLLYFSLCFLMIGINSVILGISPSQFPASEIVISNNAELQVLPQMQAEPCTIVIFGATGDLTARKLLPAIYKLADEGNLSRQTAVVGFARGKHNDETFRVQMYEALERFSKIKQQESNSWHEFAQTIFYNQSDFESDQGYENLKLLLYKIDQELGTQGNRIYYLATHPDYFPVIIRKLYEHQLVYGSADETEKWSRVIIEKPFGHDFESATDLQLEVDKYLDDSSVYRMDHYLGKEGVQNLLTFRFANSIFEPLWNSCYIDNVQITLAEDIGIESRANFWEETGSLRDVLQNHVMQLLAIVAMEPPTELSANAIHEEKIKVLNAILPIPIDDINNFVIRGQYGPGWIHGVSAPGYKEEEGVSASSMAETYIAAKLLIDNPRWQGVPFYVRAGKRLAAQTTEIAITFKNSGSLSNQDPNVLFIRIQPDTGVFFKTFSKVPMLDHHIEPVVFGYRPDSYFKKQSYEAYEKLLFDCIRGDSSLYVQSEEQLAAWKLLTPVLDYWKSNPQALMLNYDAGSWGPAETDRMLQVNGHQWELLTD